MAEFTNQATLRYNGNNTLSNITVGNIIDPLSINKTAVSNTYSEGENITYTISLVNTESVEQNGLTLTDNLGSAEYDGTVRVPLTYTDGSAKYYINGVLQDTVNITSTDPLTIENIRVPANGNALIVYQTNANSLAPLAAGSTVTNTATLSDGNLAAPISDTETVTVEEQPDLSITKSVSPDTVAPNGQITYTFVIQNSGNAPTEAGGDLVVIDTFDPQINITSVTLDGAPLPDTSYTYTDGVFETNEGVLSVPAAEFGRDAEGNVTVNPGETVLRITGTI